MSGTTNSSEHEEIIPLDSKPESKIIQPKTATNSKPKEPVYYEDPGNFTVFGLDRDYSSEDSSSESDG